MKLSTDTTGETPPDDSGEESPAESTTRWRRIGELLQVWGTAVEVWLKILAMVLVGVATLLKSVPFH